MKSDELELSRIGTSDKAFALSMADDPNLNDPLPSEWDDPFKTRPPIHGVFKVAGNKPTIVEEHLKRIKTILGATIVDAAKVVGAVRDGSNKGHEQ